MQYKIYMWKMCQNKEDLLNAFKTVCTFQQLRAQFSNPEGIRDTSALMRIH